MNASLAAREPVASYLATPPLLQHFDRVAQAPGGVARLRELILTLAVQGKLVPQDPADEPASLLLERIRAEKARLVKEGKIRKEKPLAAIAEEEKPFALPAGWEWVRLINSSVLENGDRGNNYPSKGDFVDSGVRFINAGHLRGQRVEQSEMNFISKERFDVLRSGKIQRGDILYCLRGSLGKTALVDDDQRGAIASSLVIIRPTTGLNAKFALLFLAAPPAIAQISKFDNGTAQPNLGATDLAKFMMPLPPLAEQSRIVARVEELMALCDALEEKGRLAAAQHERLAGALFDALANSASAEEAADHWQRIAAHFDLLLDRPAAVDRLEQAILQLAVRGRLVPQNPAEEPASALLQKIRAEKDRLIAAGQLKRDKPLPPISDEERQFELPEGWGWTRTPDIAQSRLGKMLDAAKNTGAAYPYLRNTNLQWRRFDLSDIKEIYLEPYELDEYRLLPGDLLICEGGEPGRCAVWLDAETEMYFQKALHRARPFGGVSSEYLAIVFEADVRAGRLDELFTGATIKHFTGQALERYVFALPPLAEQSRIVARVAELRAVCAQLRNRLATTARTRSRLAEALLEQAVT